MMFFAHRVRWMFTLAMMLPATLCAAAIPATTSGQAAQEDDAWRITSANAIIQLAADQSAPFQLTTRIRLAPSPQRAAAVRLLGLGLSDGQDINAPAMGRLTIITSSVKNDGRFIRFQTQAYDTDKHKWIQAFQRQINYWPTYKQATDRLAVEKVQPVTWHDRWIPLRIQVSAQCADVYADHVFVGRIHGPWEGRLPGSIHLRLNQDDAIGPVVITPWKPDPRFTSVDLAALARETTPAAARPDASHVPFALIDQGRKHLSLRQAHWYEQQQDPQSFYEFYDGGPLFLHDLRMPMVSVPKADYLAAHLLVMADDDPALDNILTLRAGRFGYNQQVRLHDFSAVIPRQADAGGFTHVTLPMQQAFAQDLVDDVIEIELTKQVRLARHVPDVNRFRYRPLGPASGVRIAAMTLELSPLQIHVSSKQPGHAFVLPDTPAFEVRLTNITHQAQPFTLRMQATHLRQGQNEATRAGQVEAGQSVTLALPISAVRNGYHDLVITLHDQDGRLLLKRVTSFAQLPRDTRQHRSQSPFGTWEWNGTHITATDSDVVGSMFKKLGFRYGMSGHSLEARRKWGMTFSTEPKLDPELTRVQRMLQRAPDMPMRGLIFHEDSISGPHVTRVPDLFTDRPAYKLNEAEEKRFQTMLDDALRSAKAAREKYPGMSLSFGNGPLPTKEEFYRRKFPAEFFDKGGNEAGSFHRLPEAQPPDFVANNASIWMDRQMLDAYGYADKPVHQCYEICCPSDNPGNLASTTQADYFVRNALHSLAWEMPFLHIGQLMDVGNSYYFSNWGASGLCRAFPEMNVKPAYVALANMTLALDGATFAGVQDMGSPSLYGLWFTRPDGQRVLAYWTLRGQRSVHLRSTGQWQVMDDQGNTAPLELAIVATPSPAYLIGQGEIQAIEPQQPTYDDAPPDDAIVIDPLDGMDNWAVSHERDVELETYNFMTPRRQGDFQFGVKYDPACQAKAVVITPRPITHGKDTMPMYVRLEAIKPVPMPGKPDEIGLYIRGQHRLGQDHL